MKQPARFLIFGAVVCSAALWGAVRYGAVFKPKPEEEFKFPTRELAAIDRDLQARFAVVPTKDFGIERTYGYQHYLYNPQTSREIASVAALKKQDTEAAFYLMSRALWLRSWDGWGFKPIQGPVVLTGKISAPLPRKINFLPFGEEAIKARAAVLDQEDSSGADGADDLTAHNPAGTPVPSPTALKNMPTFNQLQALGNRVFELAEAAPVTANIGVAEKLSGRWSVAAVPIRASNVNCLPCHKYQPMAKSPNATERLTVKVGDALGVAFYLYRTRPTTAKASAAR